MKTFKEKKQDNQFIDFDSLFKALLKNWYIIAFCLGISVGIMYVVNKFIPPQYVVGGSILLHVEQQRSPLNNNGEYLQANQFFGIERNFLNELVILQSSPLLFEAIEDQEIYFTYWQKNRLFYNELYKTSPFRVEFDTLSPQATEAKFTLTFIDGNHFRLKTSSEKLPLYDYFDHKIIGLIPSLEIDKVYKIGEEIKLPNNTFRVLLNENVLSTSLADKKYAFKLNNLHQLTAECKKRLSVNSVNEDVTVATLSLRQPDILKGRDILNALISKYLEKNLEKKNNLADKTIGYIDMQLSTISDSLSTTERELQDFRARNEVIDISQKAQRFYARLQELETEKTNIESNYKYYEYLVGYFAENRDASDMIAPSSVGIEDQLLNSLIEELIEVSQQKNNLMVNNQEKSPYIPQLNTRINNLKNTITENLDNILTSTQISLNDINERIDQVNRQIRQLPRTERQLLGINRRFELNNEIYNFLLQRRTEAEIAKASNKPEHEIIEPPSYWYVAFPDPKINYTLAIFIGLLIPGGIIFVRVMLDKTVKSKKDIENISELPVIGTIYHSNKTVNLFTEKSSAHIAESFRTIRTNLEYFSAEKNGQVYLVTSSHSGEGKTFSSFNIAKALSLNGNKTVYLSFDLRKTNNILPHQLVETNLGITTFLINRASIEDIIFPSGFDNFDLIGSGSLPPNPLEIISSGKTNVLLETLREMYDYIIVDTPPVGVVTDAFVLMKYSDVNLFMVRQNVTSKNILEESFKELDQKNINHLAVIYNDIRIDGDQYKKYGYKEYYKPKDKKTAK